MQGDRVVAVGDDDAALLALAGPGTLRLDLRGRIARPGVIDAHAHMGREGLRRIYVLRGDRLVAVRPISARGKMP